VTALISESVEPRPQLILAVAAHEQRLEIEQLDLAVAEAAHRADGAPCVDVNAAKPVRSTMDTTAWPAS
jgi:hypothetical protein